jgi:anti-sigma factor RsiW
VTDDEMTCREVLELLTEYLEGALPPAARAPVAAHLDDCEPCDRFLQQLTLTISLTATLSEDDIADDVRDSLLRAFRTWRRSGPDSL